MKNLKSILCLALFLVVGGMTLSACGGSDSEDPHQSGTQDEYTMNAEVEDYGNLAIDGEDWVDNLKRNCDNCQQKLKKTFEQNAITLFTESYVPQISAFLEKRYQNYMDNTAQERIYFTVNITLRNSSGKLIKSHLWTTPQ